MDDHTTKLADLRDMVRHFVDQRDWQQFHSPKNLSMALAIEAAELMEHFQWLSTEASRNVSDEPQTLQAVGEELADIQCYLLALANELDLDISSIMESKMSKNCQKYPLPQPPPRVSPGTGEGDRRKPG